MKVISKPILKLVSAICQYVLGELKETQREFRLNIRRAASCQQRGAAERTLFDMCSAVSNSCSTMFREGQKIH